MISILVPIYNGSKYIERNISTLLNQTYEDLEIICINDGSTDDTADVLNRLAGSDPRIIAINKKNSGYGNSMNLGIQLSSGEYLGILEGDDFTSTNMYSDLLFMIEDNNADIVKSDWFYYFDNQKVEIKANQVSDKIVTDIQEDFSPLLIQASIWSCLYRKEFLLKNDIRFLETPGASYQDTSFAFKCFALSKKTILTEKAFLKYRLDNAQSSVNSSNKIWEITEEYKEIYKFLLEHQFEKTSIFTPFIINLYHGFIWNLKRIKSEYKTKFASYFKDTLLNFQQKGMIKEEFLLAINKKSLEEIMQEIDFLIN